MIGNMTKIQKSKVHRVIFLIDIYRKQGWWQLCECFVIETNNNNNNKKLKNNKNKERYKMMAEKKTVK